MKWFNLDYIKENWDIALFIGIAILAGVGGCLAVLAWIYSEIVNQGIILA